MLLRRGKEEEASYECETSNGQIDVAKQDKRKGYEKVSFALQ